MPGSATQDLTSPPDALGARARDPVSRDFRSPRGLGLTLTVLLWLGLVLIIGTIAVLLQVRGMLPATPGSLDPEQGAALVRVAHSQQALGVLEILLLLVTYATACFWIYRVASNVRALGAVGLDDRPGWAVGWFFIPFANLFKPFRSMVQIWQASQSPSGWRRLPTPALLGWWWGSWLVDNFVGTITARLTKADNLDSLRTMETALVVAQVLSILSHVLFLLVVHRLTRLQIAQHRMPAAPEAPLPTTV